MNRGQFITLEGSEGAGKSTNVAVICDCLNAAGVDYHHTREPGGTPLAEYLREALLQDWQEPVDGLTELFIVFAARRQHILQEIEPRLAAGQWVVCDRFTDATYAYQGSARGVDQQYIATLEQWVQEQLQPDLTIYLDLAPQQAETRIADRPKDRLEMEQRSFFEAVRQGYLQRAQSHTRIQLVDAGRPLDQVQQAVAEIIQKFLTSTQNRQGAVNQPREE
ncbi:MAG: dTMP kinase [Pseudomonadota bacterium]